MPHWPGLDAAACALRDTGRMQTTEQTFFKQRSRSMAVSVRLAAASWQD